MTAAQWSDMAKQWLKTNLTCLVTLGALLAGTAATWGRMGAAYQQIDGKADKAAVTREMDQIHEQLNSIEGKLDAFLLHNRGNE